MFRQFASRTIAPLYIRATPNVRYISYSRSNLSVVDSAKDILHKANKKTGEVLASAMDTTEKVTPSTEQVKDAAANAASTANHKAGEVLADGMGKAENIGQKAKQQANDANLGEKAKDAAQSASESAENLSSKAKEGAEDLSAKTKDNALDFAQKTKEATTDMKDHAQAKKKVLENTSGYESLQDKGAKVETEQNRPDDAV